MVLVKNPTKRPITVVIAHADAPKTDVAFHQQLHDPKSGDIAERRVDMRLPESVTLLGGEERDLPGYAKKEALAAGLVAVKQAPLPDEAQGVRTERTDKAPRTSEPKDEGLPNALKKKRGSE